MIERSGVGSLPLAQWIREAQKHVDPEHFSGCKLSKNRQASILTEETEKPTYNRKKHFKGRERQMYRLADFYCIQ